MTGMTTAIVNMKAVESHCAVLAVISRSVIRRGRATFMIVSFKITTKVAMSRTAMTARSRGESVSGAAIIGKPPDLARTYRKSAVEFCKDEHPGSGKSGQPGELSPLGGHDVDRQIAESGTNRLLTSPAEASRKVRCDTGVQGRAAESRACLTMLVIHAPVVPLGDGMHRKSSQAQPQRLLGFLRNSSSYLAYSRMMGNCNFGLGLND